MDHLPTVHIFQSEANLHEPIEYFGFREDLGLGELALDVVGQVTD